MNFKYLDYEKAQMAFSSQLEVYRCNYRRTCDGLRFERFDDCHMGNLLEAGGPDDANILLGALVDDTPWGIRRPNRKNEPKLLYYIGATWYLVRQPRKLATVGGGFEFIEGLRVFQAYRELHAQEDFPIGDIRDGVFKHALRGDYNNTLTLCPEFVGQASTLLPKLLELGGYIEYGCDLAETEEVE